MASSSTSSSSKSFKYDVFLSFRGEDTRKNFVDHLYFALMHKSIHTYKDDERIKKGKTIGDELINSIEDSKFYIIVFSKNYASSSWCLDELVKIMECQKMTDHTAYPVFYDVEPTEIRKQSGPVGEAFAKYENYEAVGKWRQALKEAADLAGWELKNTVDGHEAKFIQKIVEEISLELRSISLSVDEKLVGMKTRMTEIISSLEVGVEDVRMLGIKGMGGAGKTTLARAVFDHIGIHFEGKSFVENVREVSTTSSSGLKSLQKQVLSDLKIDQLIINDVGSVYDGKNMMKKIMRGRKVLLVLDDVDHLDHLEALSGDPNWFKPGSRIIITTRDEQVLVSHRINFIHNVNLLTSEEAICLFSRYAFGREIPIQGYEHLSKQVVRYAAGLPLTIRVLGSFLCGKDELEWTDALERLKTIPLKETLKKLELSYDGLEEDYKEIFLDVACLLKGWNKDRAVMALESCGFHARNGLRVIEQKSLITIDALGRLEMHDHIEEMGKNIVRRMHPDEPNRHSRLWINKEIEDILANDSGTEATRCIKLITTNIEIVYRGLGNMKNLRFLWVNSNRCYLDASEDSQHLSNALRYLRWDNYPYLYLPETFQANNLVGLVLTSRAISQLWKGGERKVLTKLKFLDISCSDLTIFDIGPTPNLVSLNLEGCEELEELSMPDGCPKLTILDVSGSKLRNLYIGMTLDLEELNLEGCNELEELSMPDGCQKLKILDVSGSKLRNFDLGMTPNLMSLDLAECEKLEELHMPDGCPKLNYLNVSGSKLRNLYLGMTLDLEEFYLEGCNELEELSMDGYPKLTELDVRGSKLRNLYLGMTPNLVSLNLAKCEKLEELHMPDGCPKLNYLDVSGSKLRNLYLGMTLDLEELNLGGCNELEELSMPDGCQRLKILDVSGSKLRNFDLGMTPNLMSLNLAECEKLEELHLPDGCPKLKFLVVSCSKLRNLDLGMAPYLETLEVKQCICLEELHMPFGCPKLKSISIIDSSKLRNLNLGMCSDLGTMNLVGCFDLVELHMPFGCPKLKSVSLDYTKLRNLDLRMSLDLERLSLKGCCDMLQLHLPDAAGCQNLTYINLNKSMVRKLNLGQSLNLETLDLKDCYNLVEIYAPVGWLKKIDYLCLSGCWRFKYFSIDHCFRKVEVDSLSELYLTGKPLDICPLHTDSNMPKFRFKCYFKKGPKSLAENVEKLISLGLCACTNLEKFSESICSLQYLRKLTLEVSIPEVPRDLDRLQCLEELILSSTKIKCLPDSILMLKHLKLLELKSCWLIEKLPEELGQLKCLQKLYLRDCVLLQDIPKSICEINSLEYLYLPYCILVEKLPEEFGFLTCLKELDVEGTGISHLPDSIFGLKGLCIIGSRWQLESYGFTSLYDVIGNSIYTVYCYI